MATSRSADRIHWPLTIVFSARREDPGGVRLAGRGVALYLHFTFVSMVLEAADNISERRKQQSN